jgi:hypothetical protein
MNTTQMHEVNARFERGNPLTDYDIKQLLAFYEKLYSLLTTLSNEEYRLVTRDVWQKLTTLKGFKEHRK